MSDPRHRRGLVPLSADPVTTGHLDLIVRAADACDELIVAVMDNDLKKGRYVFDLEERAAMIDRAVKALGVKNARVMTFGGLLTDLYLREDGDAIFRGVRNAADEMFERQQMEVHVSILPAVAGHFHFLPAREGLDSVSSTLVKAMVMHHLDISDKVPAFVMRALQERLVHQAKIGLTGGIAVGKTQVGKDLAVGFKALTGIDAHPIDVDQLVRNLYGEQTAGAQAVREGIAKLFGDDALTDDRRGVNRAVLAERVFCDDCDPKRRLDVQALTQPHVDRLLREALTGKRGLIILEWAQMAEMSLGRWANHHVVVVDSPDREKFAEARGIPKARLEAIRAVQWTAEEKVRRLKEDMLRAGDGSVLRYTNRWMGEEANRMREIQKLAVAVADRFPHFIAKEAADAHRPV